jgi:signal transduction histidine kinase
MASTGKVPSSTVKFPETKKVSLTLILFRWVAFVVVFLFIYQEPGKSSLGGLPFYLVVSITFLYTTLISYFYGKGLQNFSPLTKILVVVDTFYCGFLVWLTGSLSSPFFLYALSPILTAAFFFKMAGGLAAAGTISSLYLGGLAVHSYSWSRIMETQKAGDLAVDLLAFFFVGAFFAYPSSLLDRLLSTVNSLIRKNDNLTDINKAFERANRQLRTLHKTSKALQSTLNLNEILDIVLSGITAEIGLEGAMLGFCDEENKVLTNWILSASYHSEPVAGLKELRIPISDSGGPIAKSVIDRRPYLVSRDSKSEKILPRHLRNKPFAVLPMTFKDRIVGVIVVDNHLSRKPISEKDIPVLKSIANQAAVAIENAKLMVKNQALVVTEERSRIAREIHDGLAQSLFSIALNLQACVKKMGDDPAGTRDKLGQLQELASNSLKELRQYIYNLPSTNLVDRGLASALRSHVEDVSRLNGLESDFSLLGTMGTLASEVEECLYRVGQEALANVVKHAKASKVYVSLEFKNGSAILVVADNGRGLNGVRPKESMGISNMKRRVESLSGTLTLEPNNGCGACVRASVPISG